MKFTIMKICILFILFSCTTTSDNEKINKSRPDDIPPLFQLNTDKGFVFGNNVGDHYFIFFLPGKEIKLDVAQGNLLIILDNQVYQLLTNEIPKNDLKKYSRTDILTAYRNYEADYIQEQVSSDINFYDDKVFTNEDNNKTILLWGYDQPDEFKSSETSAQAQLYMTFLDEYPLVFGINCPVFDRSKLQSIQETMIKIISNVEYYDEYIDDEKMNEFYVKHSHKY